MLAMYSWLYIIYTRTWRNAWAQVQNDACTCTFSFECDFSRRQGKETPSTVPLTVSNDTHHLTQYTRHTNVTGHRKTWLIAEPQSNSPLFASPQWLVYYPQPDQWALMSGSLSLGQCWYTSHNNKAVAYCLSDWLFPFCILESGRPSFSDEDSYRPQKGEQHCTITKSLTISFPRFVLLLW